MKGSPVNTHFTAMHMQSLLPSLVGITHSPITFPMNTKILFLCLVVFHSPLILLVAKFGGLNGMNRAASAEGPVQDAAIEHVLDVGLDEVYNGNSVKRVRIVRKVLDDNGMTTTEHETFLTIDVKRGWKTGTRIVFPKEGDQGPNKIPADVVFTVKIRDHETYTRDGDDLVVVTGITLVKALTNSVITLTTLDERILRIPINEIIQYVFYIISYHSPGFTKEIAGEGMPLTKTPNKKGKLVLKFNVKFPSGFSEEKKELIKQAFEA
jgi:hypothetical protein